MDRRRFTHSALVLGAVALMGACSDGTTTPNPSALGAVPVAQVSGGPDLNDFKSFQGNLWVCADAQAGLTGFTYIWRIVNVADGSLVANGVKSGVSAGECVLLYWVPMNVPGKYLATVREDPGGAGRNVRVTAITAQYGFNYPTTPPTPIVNVPARRIQSRISNDAGVQFTFFH